MKLRLTGHDYKYAVEQVMLALFPDQRPDYSPDSGTTGPEGLRAESRLSYGHTYAQATTIFYRGNKTNRGTARVTRKKLTGKLVSDRQLQRIIKQSFFRAALPFTDSPPVWGSLTGIRPAQIAAKALKSGKNADSVISSISRDYYVSPARAEMCVRAAQTAAALEKTLQPKDIALYIGIPFCPTRCSYCSFVSNSVEHSYDLTEPFTGTLLREIKDTGDAVSRLGLRVISMYIGGGTPTSIPAEAFETILSAISKSFDLSHLREYTVEAGRPDTVTEQKLEIISRYGANRICINPQSMSADVLSAIGRLHSPEDIITAADLVDREKMRLNMDIIAGLPGDTPAGFKKTLDAVLKLKPTSITVHTLSMKKGSRIKLENTTIPGGADVKQMLDHASERLRGKSYELYYLYRQKFTSGGFENTGWRLSGNEGINEGIYNICMMEELCTVLALGGGGVTKLVSREGRIERIFNAKFPREYISQTSKREEKLKKIMEFFS